jgi:hypothetical protein
MLAIILMTQKPQDDVNSTSVRIIQSTKQENFKQEWCKAMQCLNSNHSTSIMRHKTCVTLSEFTNFKSVIHSNWKLKHRR